MIELKRFFLWLDDRYFGPDGWTEGRSYGKCTCINQVFCLLFDDVTITGFPADAWDGLSIRGLRSGHDYAVIYDFDKPIIGDLWGWFYLMQHSVFNRPGRGLYPPTDFKGLDPPGHTNITDMWREHLREDLNHYSKPTLL